MTLPRLDILVFGATGVTGKYVIEALHRLATPHNLNWGIAGRSFAKLETTLKDVSQKTGLNLKVPIVIADVSNETSLREMARATKLVINVIGPYRFTGERIVRACVEEGTHHVDLSGEPQYMETVQLKYHRRAKEKNVYVVTGCGFDSVPADLGVIYLQKHFGGVLNTVEIFIDLAHEVEIEGARFNYATLESAVQGFRHSGELKVLRRELFTEKLPELKPKIKNRPLYNKSELIDKYVIPFMGADRSVIERTQRHFYATRGTRPAQIRCYFGVEKIRDVEHFYMYARALFILVQFEWGRKKILQYPEFFTNGLFSKQGPNAEKTENELFRVVFEGEGWEDGVDPTSGVKPTKKKVLEVSGRSPAYRTASELSVMSAIVILNENGNLPDSGGVYSPGAAFAETSLIEKMIDSGVKFNFVEKNIPLTSRL